MCRLSAVRHFLVYRLETDLIVVGRLLHDAMDLVRTWTAKWLGSGRQHALLDSAIAESDVH